MGQSYKLIGAPCVHREPYTFYKAFKYTKNDITNILTINEFFFLKPWNDSDLISIGELRLLWEDKNCDQTLASLRLYILPENTPDGRINDVHGEDEVLAITEKVVIRLDDLLTCITEATDWNWGLGAVWRKDCPNINVSSISHEEDPLINESVDKKSNSLVDCSAVNYSEIHVEKMQLDERNWEIRTGVVVLSYSMYCRYRGLMKRLEGVHNDWLRNQLVTALGGFTASCRTTKILFCKDTFDYPELEGHELLCNHLAPKLRSRIPKNKKSLYPSTDISERDSSSHCSSDEDNEDGRLSSSPSSSISSNSRVSCKPNPSTVNVQKKIYRCAPPLDDSVQITAVDEQKKQKAFTQNLYAFMRARLTPIGKLPFIGTKEINLFEFYNKVKHLGGHSNVTKNKLWKYVFDVMGGDNGSTATAAIIKKHYERYLLPYEVHMVQQFKSTSSNNQIILKQQSSGAYKSHNVTVTPVRFDAKPSPVVNLKPALLMSNKVIASNEAGGKENIPIKKPPSCSSSAVIAPCEPEETNTSKSPENYHNTTSSVSPEVIDLCEDSPIKRSVPSIAATLFPKKRKLDILREGGLEVTPISASVLGANEPDVVTITKTVTIDTEGNKSYSISDSASIEILNPRKYISSFSCHYDDSNNFNVRDGSRKSVSQVLDLSTMKSNGCPSSDSIIKNISPNLGPNIEISIVPTDDMQRDLKKRKSTQLPVPALRKISTGELSVRNMSPGSESKHEINQHRSQITKADAPLSGLSLKGLKPSISITAVEKSTKTNLPGTVELSMYPSNINQQLYIAAMYKSILPHVSNDENVANTYLRRLSHPSDSFADQQDEVLSKVRASFERFLKTNSITIDDCEQISE